MSTRYIILFTVVLEFGFLSAKYLEAESNYLKPKLERNNILNKKVWIKNKSNENLSVKTNWGQYIFRTNSIVVDDVLQNNFDEFSDDFMQDSPFVSSYIQRSKRSANNMRKVRPRKSLKNCVNKDDCRRAIINIKDDNLNFVESKLIPDLKPASVFNEHPYEVAILVSNNKFHIDPNDDNVTHSNNISQSSTSNADVIDLISIEGNNLKINANESQSNTTVPKRSSKYDYETETSDRIEFITDFNNTNGNNARSKTDRNIFDKEERAWHQSAPIPDVNLYKVIPKEPAKIKTVNEKALIKVISTLTKTFKKIMKQHNNIKVIHLKLQELNDELLKNITDITDKFNDFDKKYSNFMKYNDIIKNIEADLAQKEQSFKNKQKEITKNLLEFENQQRKFLTQQKQFYSVQQLILTQNEKINAKQNLIAKTQSEISHRQNNFARILKKAKQIYEDSKNTITSKTKSNFINTKNDIPDVNISKQVIYASTSIPPSSESIKINLFSIPVANRIQNQDEILIKEKNHQAIDDLVYKFYFNNTFIDNLMKSKVLSSISTAVDNREVRRNKLQNKRNELTTMLLPVNKSYIDFRRKTVLRNKRWINHYSRKHNKNKSYGKRGAISPKNNYNLRNNTNFTKNTDVNKIDPFLAMATTFCNEIRRNTSSQILGWCIEKALRRLQYMDAKLFPILPAKSFVSKTVKPPEKETIAASSSLFNDVRQSTPVVPLSPTPIVTQETVTSAAMFATDLGQNTIFFPDNDELESNLKEYELSPDTEGNVYYEGSLHASDIVGTDSQGYSDLLPDPNSNSKVDMSPFAFDYQGRRHGYVM